MQSLPGQALLLGSVSVYVIVHIKICSCSLAERPRRTANLEAAGKIYKIFNSIEERKIQKNSSKPKGGRNKKVIT